MGAFLGSIERTILDADVSLPDGTRSAVGVCANFAKPKAIADHLPIRPDCRSTEGCLFCDKYRVHADAVDIRKLVSCRHCVRLTCNRVSSLDEFESSFGVVLRRIDFLLNEIKKRNASLVTEIEEDVDVNGNLDAFWTSKLEQLFELGIA